MKTTINTVMNAEKDYASLSSISETLTDIIYNSTMNYKDIDELERALSIIEVIQNKSFQAAKKLVNLYLKTA